MDITTVIYASIVLDVGFVLGVMYLVRKAKLDQRRRQQRLVSLAKEKEDLRQENELKDELIEAKEEVIGKYREILKF